MAGGMSKAKGRRAAKTRRMGGYTSKGERRNVADQGRYVEVTPLDRMMRVMDAWKKGKRTFVTFYDTELKRNVRWEASELWGRFQGENFQLNKVETTT